MDHLEGAKPSGDDQVPEQEKAGEDVEPRFRVVERNGGCHDCVLCVRFTDAAMSEAL
jgi:hypothetical protein